VFTIVINIYWRNNYCFGGTGVTFGVLGGVGVQLMLHACEKNINHINDGTTFSCDPQVNK